MHYNFKDETGNKYGRWTVEKWAGRNKHSNAMWECKCDCGNVKTVAGTSLRSGNSTSCGCAGKETTHKKFFKDETGKKYNRLTVIKHHHTDDKWQAFWECLCDCGETTVVAGSNLRNGTTKSCGCYGRERTSETHRTHGRSSKVNRDPLYKLWCNMKSRCSNPNENGYERYGGRGISVCEEWENDSTAFIDWALANGYKKGLEIDRIDNDGNYSPKNCRFVTKKKNCRNRRNNTYVEYNGETKTIAGWAEHLGVEASALSSRLLLGWDIERVFTQPYRKSAKHPDRATVRYPFFNGEAR